MKPQGRKPDAAKLARTVARMALVCLLLVGCASPSRRQTKQPEPPPGITPERAIDIAKETFERHCLDPLSWYQIKLLPDDGAENWGILFDGVSHSGRLGSEIKLVIVNKKTGQALYFPGY